MEQLIKITEHEGRQVVSAKDLFIFLDVQSEFSHWIKRMLEYGFLEGQDFTSFSTESTGGRPGIDYALTIDCAKEISMLQRSEKGKQARLYFLECERKARNPVANLTRLDMARMLLEAEEENARILADNRVLEISNENKSVTIELQEKALQEAAPKVHYCDQVLQSTSTITTTVIAKELGFPSAIAFNKKLCELGIQYRTGGDTWVLYSKYQGQDWTRTRTYSYTDSEGRSRTNITTVWTEKGRQFLHLLLKNFPQP